MKKCISLVLCCMLLMSMSIGANAAGLNSFLTFQDVIQDESRNDLLLYSKAFPENGQLRVCVESQQIEDPVLSTVRQEKLPVTVYCLVDITTDMSNKQIQEQQDILNVISSRMGEGDSMVITTVGSKMVAGVVLDTLEARKTAISTLKREGYAADMYKAVVDAMTSLENKTSYCTNRCLLILSNGAVPQNPEKTQQQALDAINSTSIPVYAIGITGGYDNAFSLNNAKKMVTLAEASVGGFGVVPAGEKVSAADAAQGVWEAIQESAVIKVNLAELSDIGNAANVTVRYETGDVCLEDSVSVDLSGVTPLAEAAEEAEEATDSEVEDRGILIGACVAAVAVVVIIVFFAVKKKKKNKAQQKAQAAVDLGAGTETILTTGDFHEQTECVKESTSEDADKGIVVQMKIATHQDVSISFPLRVHESQVLGRDDRANIILNAEDYQLSGRHCMVEWDGNYLYIQDVGSTNGTVLNGIHLKPNSWNRLNSGSVIHMGSFDYNVTIDR